MPTITFDVGGANISVPCQRAGKAAKRRLGAAGPTANGNLRSFIRDEFHEIPLILIRITPEDAAAIEALFANGGIVPCAGDVVNNGGATIRCLGDYTDNMEPADTLRTPSVFLHEVGPVSSGAPVTVPPLLFTEDAGTPGAGETGGTPLLAKPTGTGAPGQVRILNAATPATCGTFPDPGVTCAITYSATPERTWASPPLVKNGWITGVPRVGVLTIGGTGDQWAHQGTMFKIFHNRAGTDIHTVLTPYGSNGGFSGGYVEVAGPSAVIWEAQIGDRFRVEAYGRLALHGGYTDGNDGSNLDRQTILYGGSPSAVGLYIGNLVNLFIP